jgi:hypothetical protein
VKNSDEWEVTYEDTDDGRIYASKLSTGPHEMPPPLFWAPGACVAKGPSLRVVPAQAAERGTPLAP